MHPDARQSDVQPADPAAGGQAPGAVRLAAWTAAAIALAGAVYLIAVRGEALLADLAAIGSKVWCF